MVGREQYLALQTDRSAFNVQKRKEEEEGRGLFDSMVSSLCFSSLDVCMAPVYRGKERAEDDRRRLFSGHCKSSDCSIVSCT